MYLRWALSAWILEEMHKEKPMRWGLASPLPRDYGRELLCRIRRRKEQEAVTNSFREDVEGTG